MPTAAVSVGGMFCTYFQAKGVFNFADVEPGTPAIFGKFFRSMLDSGINLAPSQYEAGFMSVAHSKDDLDQTIEAAKKAYKAL